MNARQGHLFNELNKARYGENRRTRPLFLPNLLLQEPKKFLEESAENAHKIILKWADLESSGKLEHMISFWQRILASSLQMITLLVYGKENTI